MKIFVAGGRGYLGSVLCNLLAELRHEVTSVDLGWFPTTLDPKVEDICDNLFNVSNLDGFDVLIFAAGISNDPMADRSPSQTFSYNVGLPFYLGKLAKKSGVKHYVHAGSCSVYGWQDREVTETDETLTQSYYGMSKLLGEKAVMSLASPDFKVTSFRMGTLAGVSPRMRYDLMFNALYASGKSKGKVTVFDPDVWRPCLHVEEAASAYLQAIETGMDGIFNLCSFNCRVIDAAHAVQKHLNCEIEILNSKDIRNYRIKKRPEFLTASTPDSIVTDLVTNDKCDFDPDYGYNIKVYEKCFDSKKLN